MSTELILPAAADGSGKEHQSTEGVPPPDKPKRRRRQPKILSKDDLLAYLEDYLKRLPFGFVDPREVTTAGKLVDTILKHRADQGNRGVAKGPLDFTEMRKVVRSQPFLLDQLQKLLTDEQLDELLGE